MFARLVRGFKTTLFPASYVARDPQQWGSHYYFDLAPIIATNERLIFKHPTTTAFFGLAAVEQGNIVQATEAAQWLLNQVDDQGRIWLRVPIPKHFHSAGDRWYSGMTQGLAVSLLVRLWSHNREARLETGARLLAAPLFRSLNEGGCLSTELNQGPFIEEICCEPAMHVLNGAVFGYWGISDLLRCQLADSHQHGIAKSILSVLVNSLPQFNLPLSWTKYDLRQGIVASREYHRLHAVQASVLAIQSENAEARRIATAWSASDRMPRACYFACVKAVRETNLRYKTRNRQ